jgi:hypothetical protein
MTRFTGPPMDLANMRLLRDPGRHLLYCACGYQAHRRAGAAGRLGRAICEAAIVVFKVRPD